MRTVLDLSNPETFSDDLSRLECAMKKEMKEKRGQLIDLCKVIRNAQQVIDKNVSPFED